LQEATEECKVRANYRFMKRWTMHCVLAPIWSVQTTLFGRSWLLHSNIWTEVHAHVVIGKRCVHPCIFRAQELLRKKGKVN